MSYSDAAAAIYRVKDRFRGLRRLVPKGLRQSIFRFVTNRAIRALPSRTFMETDLLPALARHGSRKMLFVGTHDYIRGFVAAAEGIGICVWTVEIDPARAHLGSPRGHFTADLQDVDTVAQGYDFDVAIVNGVLGFGLDTPVQGDRAARALTRIMKPGAIVIMGWNPGLCDEAAEAFSTCFRSATVSGLPHMIEFAPSPPIQPYPHRYENSVDGGPALTDSKGLRL